MVATETWVLWWWARCQAMVSGPASRPAAVSVPRSSVISVTVAGGIAVGPHQSAGHRSAARFFRAGGRDQGVSGFGWSSPSTQMSARSL